MKVAIVGSRKYPDPGEVARLVNSLPSNAVVVSGGAEGPDSLAVQVARERGLAHQVFPAKWETLGRAAGLIRNGDIVQACDRLVAFWDLKSRGTKDTINKALQAGKVVTIYPPPLLKSVDFTPEKE